MTTMTAPAPTALAAYDSASRLPTLDRVRTPRRARRFARFLLVLLLLFPVALVFLPWQQTLTGKGKLVALDPGEREQYVTATVDGLVGAWKVKQQDYVERGAVIVELTDTDSNLEGNLNRQLGELLKRTAEFTERIGESEAALAKQSAAVAAAVVAAERNKEAVGKSKQATLKQLDAARADLEFRKTDFAAYEQAARGGPGSLQVVSTLEYQQRKAAKEAADAAVGRIIADLARLDEQVAQADAQVAAAKATGARDEASLRRQIATDKAELNALEVQVTDLKVRINRFQARVVRAPVSGWVQEVLPDASQAGMYVKTGQKLAVIVPDAGVRAVELTVSGVDAPLILAHHRQTGQWPHVRLQFQGYPALQFQGWPSAAFGTFGGRIVGMNPTDDGRGGFTVLVVEDPSVFGESDRWPPADELRQGNLALGWAFLNRVTLGWELWRRLNGFPPVTADPPPADANGKRPKIKGD